MALFTKCIFKEKSSGDGIRISVMSRHTLSDGITPDLRITKDLYDEHLMELAPRPKLVGAYYRNQISWEEFEKTYIADLRESEISKKVDELVERSIRTDLTILCVEEWPDINIKDGILKCHRRLLAEECQHREPNLVIEHH